MSQIYRCGLYKRLSREDENAGESTSIEHQGVLLREYAAKHGFEIVDEYADDGYSGTSFDRPEVQRLLEDAKSGRINTIIVKDLSRFGRNYIEVGQYVDYIFPAYGIRFIAISDNVDTAIESTAMDMMPIMNVFNEWHAANTSKKIRAVLDSSRRSGKYTSWSYPYGYKAGNDGDRTAVIDGQAAEVVKRIFDMRMLGQSFRAIARALSDDGIPNPATHFTRLDGKKPDKRCSPYWNSKTVMHILSDPTYLGKTVQHKTTRVSYKNHKVLRVPESEYIIKENAHEAIVSRDIWDKVQAVNIGAARGRADKTGKVHTLSGLLVCADCGKKLKLKAARSGNFYFVCRTYADLGKKYCTSHGVSEAALEQLVLQDIRSMSGNIEFDGKRVKERFLRKKYKSIAENRLSDEKLLKSGKTRLSELDKLIESAFEEKVLGNLPYSVCKSLCKKYQAEKETIERAIGEIENRLSESVGNDKEAEEYSERLRRYLNCEELTREICLRLIESICVGGENESGVRDISINYRFADYEIQTDRRQNN